MWPYYDDDGNQYDLIMNLNEKIRFRVETIHFNPPSNSRKIKHKQKMNELAKKRGIIVQEAESETQEDVIVSPMVIIV